MKFFWYQPTGGSEAWQRALSEHRAKVLADLRPAFTTVLDTSAIPESGMSKEELDAIRYSGPFYLDWDAEPLEEAIKGFHDFLKKLTDMAVDLHSLRLFATDGRGFHVEVPEEVFLPKVPKGGIQYLPGIYREMAMELLTEAMDMRIYTAKRGRMWRTPNVLRTSGLYKVPLTVDQALAMTVEDYAIICSKPQVSPELTASNPCSRTTLPSPGRWRNSRPWWMRCALPPRCVPVAVGPKCSASTSQRWRRKASKGSSRN